MARIVKKWTGKLFVALVAAVTAILLFSACSCDWSVQRADSNINAEILGNHYYECATHALLEMQYQDACDILREGVSHDDALSMVALGEAYENGTFGVVDYIKALNLYRHASEKGNFIGMRNYGLCLLTGLGGIHDNALADTMLQQSCQKAISNLESSKDLIPSHILLGYAYSGGYGGLCIDDIAAIKHFSTALKMNKECGTWNAMCIEAAQSLIDIINEQEESFTCQVIKGAIDELCGWVDAHDFDNADTYLIRLSISKLGNLQSETRHPCSDIISTLSRQADNGDIMAMYILGCLIIDGFGDTLNKEDGCKWIIKASKLGLLQAKIELAELIRNGFLPKENHPSPEKIMYEVAESGDPSALLHMACWYMFDDGGTNSKPKADKLLKQAAILGDVDARRILRNGLNAQDLHQYAARVGIVSRE